MTRIATLAANEHLLGMLTRTRNQVQDLQTQVATGKRAQAYTGIAEDTRELLGLERGRQVLQRFDRNNDLLKTRLDVKDGGRQHCRDGSAATGPTADPELRRRCARCRMDHRS